MVNQVKQVIKEKLVSMYPTYHMYLEEEQPADILKPALRILGLKKTTQNQREKLIKNIQLEIICLIEGADQDVTYWNISDQLDEAMTYVDLEGIRLRTGEKKVSEIREGQLHYTFNVQLIMSESAEAAPIMQSMDKRIDV